MTKPHLASISLFIASLATSSGAELTKPSVLGWQMSEITAPDSRSDYNPYSKLILPDDQRFAIVQARFKIEWADADNEKEELEHSYADIALTLADGTNIAPIASITSDGRIDTFSKPEREDIEAKESRGAEELRWGAIFILPNSTIKQGDITFIDSQYPVEFATTQPPHPSEQIRVEITSTDWLKTNTSAPGAERRIPDASLKLEFPGKGLFQVELNVHALKPNVIGGENRMIFKPSDFSLKTEHGSIEPIGILGSRGQITRSTIYNISRRSLEDLPEASTDLKLLFKAPDTFEHGQLEYFGKAIAEITAPAE
ncbi:MULTISPECIES: hypothetical protein [unclassified Lentimonas]|uniref:hypothetical protein n=1 Tax=unclassified Lentimonas TaxID=2630993 RepID=UPI0013242769|nr:MULTISPECIES: hypothetical protein [unclassified Lentimonas]CAA6678802.1 Unannotated [Lentimonas sp. CC4]CAA6684406.1 Unannotated [Lentimonas sp. CC6]CAA7077515.1 Unannotated [Lentimonas sp. CC4]CAA7171349.1 Unannotated [Lentimonas sp. CC21]CAA7183379.1 Unannotated [Lentimonas sp. CC8]